LAKITYVEFSGLEHAIDVIAGQTVMQGAKQNGVPGIDADCGGACSCATCHIYISAEWAGKLGEVTETEKSMLEFANDATSESRLSCQIKVTEALDGLIVRMPAAQH
jgi:2Fe-2S ferredoxin